MNTPAPPLERLEYDTFRRKIAGLIDPDRPTTVGEKHVVRECAHDFCCILARLYGVSDDRTQLWGHISKALNTSCAKVSDCDLDRWASLCLESIQADPVEAAANEQLGRMLESWATWEDETRYALLNYIRSRLYAVIVHGRAKWETAKKEKEMARKHKEVSNG